MKVCLVSAFRNSPYVGRFFCQAEALSKALVRNHHELVLVLGEGDSRDGTLNELTDTLFASGLAGQIIDCSHGGPEYSSVIDARRFVQLAHVGNYLWSAISGDIDALLFVESDLVWNASTMIALLRRLKEYSAVSPMIMLRRRKWPVDAFYDTWAFRKDGTNFKHQPPYHMCYNAHQSFQVDSAGSCMVIRGEYVKQLVWDEQLFVGICKQLYALGGAVWVDPSLQVYHE